MHTDLPFIQLRNSSPKLPSLSSPSSSSSNIYLPDSAYHVVSFKPSSSSSSSSCCCCGSKTCRKLEAVNGNDNRATGFSSNSVFGTAPSQYEVEDAISSLHNFMYGISSSGSELKWLMQMLDCHVPRELLSYGQRSVNDAFQLLQTDHLVKKMVVSLSSDKALWDAIMKNELVRKLRESLCADETGGPQTSNEEPDLGAQIWRWIWDITKVKVLELFEKFQSLMREILQPPENERGNQPAADNKDQLEDKVRSSFLLSVVILLIVVVARVNRA
ncbi:hypothetical protein FNV43_RR18337 [Rhamnella rubrinervis]|uniref:Uncharacterized protein n=1 Tax=Rhamnella rubrinervis TaxID=2594499 RepID=A0A8K0E638_9ROSA|nr:hypothetical protein FNV43_RR18337 [Rhamnella rubrinervis]